MAELLEFIKSLFEESIPWLAPLVAPAILYFRWVEKKNRQTRERRIESKLDYLIELEGGRWSANTLNPTTKSSARRGVVGFMFFWAANSTARSAKKSMNFNTRRNNPMANFLSGKKKMFTFILLVVLNGLNDTLGLHLSQQTITDVSALGGGYILIEGILDIVRAFANRQPQNPQQPNSKNFIQG
jgi:hypothetical protein